MLKSWDNLPNELKNESVKPYYDKLKNRRFSLLVKRFLDILLSVFLLIILSPMFLVLSVAIFIDSPGSPFYLQERVSQYNKVFKIIKFRTMVKNADKIGAHVTVAEDPRITRVGSYIRRFRLDEIPQLINVLLGQMTFVGTRPEAIRYVEYYSKEMMATLLLPAGVTSRTSIEYRNEQELLDNSDNADETYTEQILPEKMRINLEYINKFSLKEDLSIILLTIKKVFLSKSD
jgi:lipopolysaccharide/colanic/teichoic acid biosynthesis glycosyltransferase